MVDETKMPELIIHAFGESRGAQKYVLEKFREGVYKLACSASGWIVHDALGSTAGQISIAVRYADRFLEKLNLYENFDFLT